MAPKFCQIFSQTEPVAKVWMSGSQLLFLPPSWLLSLPPCWTPPNWLPVSWTPAHWWPWDTSCVELQTQRSDLWMLLSSGEQINTETLQKMLPPPFSFSSWCLNLLSPRALSPPAGCSKAVLFLGQLTLSCSEEQLDALVGLLTHSLAFGLMSSWGTDVFIEIGVLAGLVPSLSLPREVWAHNLKFKSPNVYYITLHFFQTCPTSCSWSPRLCHVGFGERANRRNYALGYLNDIDCTVQCKSTFKVQCVRLRWKGSIGRHLNDK